MSELSTERKFLADAMLGSLAKWLRVLGYDTHYRTRYESGSIGKLVEEGRLLLSRNRRTIGRHTGSFLIRSERLGEQIHELRSGGLIHPEMENWFSRCLICNVVLQKVNDPEPLRDIPEYILYEKKEEISRCPSCGRFFWPGTHRGKMVRQLTEWGFRVPDRENSIVLE